MPERKLDYAYWQRRFRAANDKEFQEINREFFKELGYSINPLKVWNEAAGKPIIPKLNHNKDEFVKKLILDKKWGESILIIGFFNTQFAFNMGFERGFKVDGIDIKEDSVVAAIQSVKTLPSELASKFNFYCMFAENLAGLPKYDFTMSFCLEHVRDPKHVIAENLRHLNEGGYAYFTPPLKHGTNSPSHLHYFFEESDLMKLLPEGYTANIYRVKFNFTSPRDNCFVMEVFKEDCKNEKSPV